MISWRLRAHILLPCKHLDFWSRSSSETGSKHWRPRVPRDGWFGFHAQLVVADQVLLSTKLAADSRRCVGLNAIDGIEASDSVYEQSHAEILHEEYAEILHEESGTSPRWLVRFSFYSYISKPVFYRHISMRVRRGRE